jgi:hypothetical protein
LLSSAFRASLSNPALRILLRAVGVARDALLRIAQTLTSPNRVYDFYLVAFAHEVLCMLTFWHDFAIDFHGNRAPGIAAGIEQGGNADGFSKFARHTIQLNCRHLRSLT